MKTKLNFKKINPEEKEYTQERFDIQIGYYGDNFSVYANDLQTAFDVLIDSGKVDHLLQDEVSCPLYEDEYIQGGNYGQILVHNGLIHVEEYVNF